MNELIQLVQQKTGIPQDKAMEAVNTVLGYLKQHLPAPIASQIDGVIGKGQEGQLAEAAKGLGGLFGKE